MKDIRSWIQKNISDQTGKVIIVTGSNAGIGFETARTLVKKGAHVIMACRNKERGKMALKKIEQEQLSGQAELSILDLSGFDSIKNFVSDFLSKHKRLDILINNAGVMFPPFSKTEEGFEMQIGVNFIGHFLLTGLLLDILNKTPSSRVVTLSSIAHRQGKIDFNNFSGEKPYKPIREYSQSKLADLLFALELQNRLSKVKTSTISLAAHPGITKSELQRYSGFFNFATKLIGMKTAQGALPILLAATDHNANGGEFYGPNGWLEIKGHPKSGRKMNPLVNDKMLLQNLWKKAEELTGIKYGS